jgi:hypothetical protein
LLKKLLLLLKKPRPLKKLQLLKKKQKNNIHFMATDYICHEACSDKKT